MRYFYLKLGKGNKQLYYWLQHTDNNANNEENVFVKPCAAIFFGKITTDECREILKIENSEEAKLAFENILKRNGEKKSKAIKDRINQIRNFFDAENNPDVQFISIYKNKLFIFKSDGNIFDMAKDKMETFYSDLKKREITIEKKDTIKVMPVKIIKFLNKNIPHVLRTLNTNTYLIQGTCREIDQVKYWGTIQAIKKVLDQEMERIKNPSQLFNLLSPHQFETLFFLILINKGLYSPAWRAGSLADVDIFGINYYESDTIEIGKKLYFKKDEEKSFQVKREIVNEKFEADYTVALGTTVKNPTDHFLTSEWLLDVIKEQPETRKWLESSLKWYAEGLDSIIDLVN